MTAPSDSTDDRDAASSSRREELREVATNARQVERELIAAKLEAELLALGDASTSEERAYRQGWNDRAASVVRELRGGEKR